MIRGGSEDVRDGVPGSKMNVLRNVEDNAAVKASTSSGLIQRAVLHRREDCFVDDVLRGVGDGKARRQRPRAGARRSIRGGLKLGGGQSQAADVDSERDETNERNENN